MDRINKWINTAVGRSMDPDGAYGRQCKDTADDYSAYLFGNWVNTVRPGNAKDVFANSNGEFFVKIVNNFNDPNCIPKRGDILIWGAMRGNPYGHIAVVEYADKNGCRVIEQDGFKNVPAYINTYMNYNCGGVYPIGWLRPRLEKIIGFKKAIAKNERVTAVAGYAREQAKSGSKMFQLIDANSTVAMKGYITNGEPINGNTTWFVTAKSSKYMSAEIFKDKGTHNLADLTPKSSVNSRTTKYMVSARKVPTTVGNTPEQVVDANVPIEMKGWVHGQNIDGDDRWYVSARSGLYLTFQAFDNKNIGDLPELKSPLPEEQPEPKPEPEPQTDLSNVIVDVSNYQNDSIAEHFDKFKGVIVKAGHNGPAYGGDEFRTAPKAKFFAEKARAVNKLVGFYWLPYFSNTIEMENEVAYTINAINKLGNMDNELLFIDLEPDFQGDRELLDIYMNILKHRLGKKPLIYAGKSIADKLKLDKVDWYPHYTDRPISYKGSALHQYTSHGRVDGYDGNLDLSKLTTDMNELCSRGLEPVEKPVEKPNDEQMKILKENNSLLKKIIDFLAGLFKGFKK